MLAGAKMRSIITVTLLLVDLSLRAATADGVRHIVPGKVYDWISTTDGNSRRYEGRGVILKFEAHEEPYAVHSLLTVSEAGRPILRVKGTDHAAGWADADFAVGHMDAAHRGIDVLFASDSTGAHCCYFLEVLTFGPSGWKVAKLGWLDIGTLDDENVPFPVNPLKDRSAPPVFILGDQSFLYALEGYVGSVLPPKIFALQDGSFVDLSNSRKYRGVFEDHLAKMTPLCRQHLDGACAALVADSARLGRLHEGWQTMLQNYDPKDIAGLPQTCTKAACRQKYKDFPAALAALLVETKYATQQQIPKH